MMAGAKVNVTENRAALHTACRRFSMDPVWVDGVDVSAELARVRRQLRAFSEDIRQGRITGTTAAALCNIVLTLTSSIRCQASVVASSGEADPESAQNLVFAE